jgi:hypothetical protein
MDMRRCLEAFRDLVVQAEADGWDGTLNQSALDRGREAYRTLCLEFPAAAPPDFERSAGVTEGGVA